MNEKRTLYTRLMEKLSERDYIMPAVEVALPEGGKRVYDKWTGRLYKVRAVGFGEMPISALFEFVDNKEPLTGQTYFYKILESKAAGDGITMRDDLQNELANYVYRTPEIYDFTDTEKPIIDKNVSERPFVLEDISVPDAKVCAKIKFVDIDISLPREEIVLFHNLLRGVELGEREKLLKKE